MLALRRGLDYSKVYCDVRNRWFLAWNQSRHIMYYILLIQYTNSEISIGLLYIRLHFVWWQWLNHCAALVRNLPTSILVRDSVCLLTFHTISQRFWHRCSLRISRAADFRTFLFPQVLRTRNGLVKMQHRRFSVAISKKRHL